MITDAILNGFDYVFTWLLNLLPTLNNIPIDSGVYNFFLKTASFLNVFLDLRLLSTYLTITISCYIFILIMRCYYILKA